MVQKERNENLTKFGVIWLLTYANPKSSPSWYQMWRPDWSETQWVHLLCIESDWKRDYQKECFHDELLATIEPEIEIQNISGLHIFDNVQVSLCNHSRLQWTWNRCSWCGWPRGTGDWRSRTQWLNLPFFSFFFEKPKNPSRIVQPGVKMIWTINRKWITEDEKLTKLCWEDFKAIG